MRAAISPGTGRSQRWDTQHLDGVSVGVQVKLALAESVLAAVLPPTLRWKEVRLQGASQLTWDKAGLG